MLVLFFSLFNLFKVKKVFVSQQEVFMPKRFAFPTPMLGKANNLTNLQPAFQRKCAYRFLY